MNVVAIVLLDLNFGNDTELGIDNVIKGHKGMNSESIHNVQVIPDEITPVSNPVKNDQKEDNSISPTPADDTVHYIDADGDYHCYWCSEQLRNGKLYQTPWALCPDCNVHVEQDGLDIEDIDYYNADATRRCYWCNKQLRNGMLYGQYWEFCPDCNVHCPDCDTDPVDMDDMAQNTIKYYHNIIIIISYPRGAGRSKSLG